MASLKARGVILTGAAAAVVVLGAKYGAELKESREAAERNEVRAETSIDDRIAMLESRRDFLLSRRAPLEEKIKMLQERQARRAKEEASKDES